MNCPSVSSTVRFGSALAAVLFVRSGLAQTTAPTTAPAATQPAASQPAKVLPKAEELVKAAIDVMGGKAAFDGLDSMHIKANMPTPDGEMVLEMNSAKPASFRLVQNIPPLSSGSNGKVGWLQNAMGYQLLEPGQIEEIRTQSNLYRMVFNLQEDFPTVETTDIVEFNNVDCYKVRMVPKNPNAPGQFGFFAVDGKLMQGMEVSQEGPLGTVKIVLTLSEWKRFEPLTLFTKLNIDQGGVPMGPMNVTEVELNNVPPSVFDPPAEVLEIVKAREAAAASQPATAPASPPTQPGSN